MGSRRLDDAVNRHARSPGSACDCVRASAQSVAAFSCLAPEAGTLVLEMARVRLKQKIATEAVKNGDRVQKRADDFFASPSAAELVRAQGVSRIVKPGQIRGFTDPDPKEADWLARELRRWRSNGRLRADPR